jgi:hypothetical protein
MQRNVHASVLIWTVMHDCKKFRRLGVAFVNAKDYYEALTLHNKIISADPMFLTRSIASHIEKISKSHSNLTCIPRSSMN